MGDVPYTSPYGGPTGPATEAVPVTPSDQQDLPFRARFLYIGKSGDVSVLMYRKTVPIIFKSAPVGRLDVSAARVMKTGTTAKDIIACR